MKTSAGGFTLMETLFAVAILSGISLQTYKFFQAPARVQTDFVTWCAQQTSYRGVDAMILDLKEAYAPSLVWSQIPPAAGADGTQLAFSKPVYVAGSLVPGSLTAYTFRYDAARRVVVRLINGVEQAPPLLANVDAPTATDPLFQQDTSPDAPHVLVLTVTIHPAGEDPLHCVRRIAILG